MNKTYSERISTIINIPANQVEETIRLLDKDATIPFIARYRKEATGGLDEVQIIKIRDMLDSLRELDKRAAAIIKSLKDMDKYSDELALGIQNADSLAKLEDIYLPYKPKRRTRASIAKEKGLEPLANMLLNGTYKSIRDSEKFIDNGKNVNSSEEALQGAADIIAEIINEDCGVRENLRIHFKRNSVFSSKLVKKKEKEGEKYKDYFDWKENNNSAPSHRILAVLRGVNEGVLKAHFLPDEEESIEKIKRTYFKGKNLLPVVEEALKDSYKRLLSSSLENETKNSLKKKADEKAVTVFSDNLRELLLAPPLGRKTILAVDPGLRTGSKIVVLDKQGKLLDQTVIYPLAPHNKIAESESILKRLFTKYNYEAIAVGNGTGGRESESFCRGIDFGKEIPVIMVNESGASVYSASEIAREEFPDQDITVRGAVSIGRRLMDPLAELVKIDPKAIGVGQYQHDVDQKLLQSALDDTVGSCVNAVGVELNTASGKLLSYVSGCNAKIANNIVDYRDKNGPFKSRNELKKVKGLGLKVFEQSAGFLRISEGMNVLDGSAVHPESYNTVKMMALDNNCSVIDLMKDKSLGKKINLENYVSESIGLPTLRDIMDELAQPGRDPRESFEVFSFDETVSVPEDLSKGQYLPGVVTNVTAFGAFVDVGVHQDGLVHISQLSDSFVKDPNDVVKVGQKVNVTVIDVDLSRKRISLSMKSS
ncbi:MAG: RNA-binding transcriptional accessory protein [Deltaproteobacteria bacterium]|nr:RNA-binding transcriptional accessory protein [Deltaproteobacteria bacterium]